ncbi:ABC transporter ATP-binding protein [Kocuria tytonicola]|uniref:ABC transporter ATP-binding protein n=1 Tax=Kocuria tytonicola TaxID=2055946 RepID=A0A3L9L691_9MICC|nr:ABC transporter ATP-binding protein [Kocuria tytonicola]
MQWAIRTSGLTKQYRGVPVVDKVDLTVTPQQVFGFLGPNGAGKSTTLKMLLGLARPTSGTVEVLGEQFTTSSARKILPRVGSLIESPSFYGHLSGRENLDIVRRIKEVPKAEVRQALETVRLTHAADKLAREYSLGMKQRLGIAMALLGRPELLILDEPTNGLDPAGIREIRELIKSLPLARELTVVVSSHLLSEIEQMADTIGIIDHGHLLYQGPLSGLEDAGRLVLTTDDAQRTAALLRSQGWQVEELHGAEITLPVYADNHVAHLVSTIVKSGVGVHRVEVRRRSLEETFLRITEQARTQRAQIGTTGKTA